MSGTRGRIIAAVLGVLVIVLLWYQFLYKPATNDVSNARQQLDQAKSHNDDLEAQVRKLQKNKQGNAQVQAQIDKLSKLIPPQPDLDSFLRYAYDIKLKSGVDWVSIAPSPPSPGAGASEIKMQIVVRGGYYQVLDYLNRFEKTSSMPRLVVIDGINVVTGSTDQNSSTGSSATPTTSGVSNGAPNLSVTLTARMFTQAAPAGTSGSTSGATGGSGTGTPTTPTTSSSTSPTTTGASN